MFSSSRTIVPLFVYLSILLSFVHAHDVSLIQREHANINMKRLMRKRSPSPDNVNLGLGDLLPPVAGAAASPSLSQSASSASTTPSQSLSASASSVSASSSASAASSASSESVSASSSASSASASSSSSASSTSSSSKTTAAPQTSETLNLTGSPTSFSTVQPSTITRTASVDAAQDTSAPAPLSGVAKTKSTTLTVLIAVAASVGGLAILWTIFRKWKLSSSKKFDERLNPIDWQPTTGEDDAIPGHRRVPSSGASSFHSGSGHGHNNSAARGNTGFAPMEHDFTAGPAAPVGGYADLARGPSPTMQENISRGPSFNRGYGNGVPLHNQAGYGSNEGYRY